ncbi:Translation initiation factor [Cyanidiococcus yangmingshanensis]|uniref:Translation initiation factor eIF2B subunit alpha n=1 Tax=Cyanidiococcus yangmingshanensis TaxID=2690220 RepID=A0A7J7IIH5_9RHOD|nr:Translation initiation factor [Cyanidiococcus yangmingshanensis]
MEQLTKDVSEGSGSSLFARRRTSQLDITHLLAASAKPSPAKELVANSEPEFDVLARFRAELARETPAAPAAVHVLTDLIRCSRYETMFGLELEVRRACDKMISYARSSELSVKAACELFLKFITRTSFDFPDFDECKAKLIQRGEYFRALTDTCRERIALLGEPFIQQGYTVLTHGGSRVVFNILERAAKVVRKQFQVVVTEGRSRPESIHSAGITNKTLRFCRDLVRLGVPVTIIPDSAVAAAMEAIDIVLLGAEAIAESGATINQTGSLNIAVAAKALNVQLFVAAESYKFVRIYPLTQRDITRTDAESAPRAYRQVVRNEDIPRQIQYECPSSDLTPGSYISLLITDLGVLTPVAVSEALMKMYQ